MKTDNEIDQSQLLVDSVQCILDAATASMTEYQLIALLNEQGWGFSIDASDPLSLFSTHFLVFNALYRLQVQYWEQQRYLNVSALDISLKTLVREAGDDGSSPPSQSALSVYGSDALLREYYLDMSHLEEATEASVNRLLNQFWERYIATDTSAEALNVFSLSHPVDYSTIKQRYRTLAMEHHPDRGGEPEIFQKINWAFGVLQRAYK